MFIKNIVNAKTVEVTETAAAAIIAAQGRTVVAKTSKLDSLLEFFNSSGIICSYWVATKNEDLHNIWLENAVVVVQRVKHKLLVVKQLVFF